MENKDYKEKTMNDLFVEEGPRNENNEEKKMTELLEKNLELSNEILEISKYIKKYIVFQRIMIFVKIFLILIPILFALVYLPPLLSRVVEPFKSVLNIYTGVESGNLDFLQDLNK
ncbi:MAG: hypothetical protein WCY43_03185 [Patescibacteria group bacterium]|nr:hypothetical protein [Patescibacteria group bacterium]